MCTCVLGYRGQALLNIAAVGGRGKQGRLLPSEYLGAQLFLINPNPLPSLNQSASPTPSSQQVSKTLQPASTSLGKPLQALPTWQWGNTSSWRWNVWALTWLLIANEFLLHPSIPEMELCCRCKQASRCIRHCPRRAPWTLRLAGKVWPPALAL